VHFKVTKIGALKQSTKCAPMETARLHVRNSHNFSPNKRTPHLPSDIQSAHRIVTQQRKQLALQHPESVQLNDCSGPMARLAEILDLKLLIVRHNDPNDDYHVELHKVVCIGSQWKDCVTFIELSTAHFLFHTGSANMRGWDLQVQVDGSFEFCA
jgi:hypothetical protein